MKKKGSVSRRTFLGASAALATGVVTPVALAKNPDDPKLSAEEQEDLLASTYQSQSGNGVATEAVHAGEHREYSSYPIYQGTTNPQYSRDGNPTIDSVEEKICALEGAEYGVATACGMAAISQTLLTHLKQGSRMVYHRCVYDGTLGLIDSVLEPNGIECNSVDMTDLSKLEGALQRKTDVVYFEVHSNPTIDVVDVDGVTELAHKAGALVIVDNTFLTPYLMQPLALGADIVIHSATKYMMGHGNGMVGIACGPKELLRPVKSIRKYMGGIMAPFNAFLLHQGLQTLPMRMERHCSNAMKVAQFLEVHPKVKRVHYPGLPGDPGYDVTRRQLKGFGGMLGIELKEDHGFKPLDFIRRKTSLGDLSTLLVTGFIEKERRGIPGNFYRMSVGIEDPEDIMADLDQALVR